MLRAQERLAVVMIVVAGVFTVPEIAQSEIQR